MKRMWKYLFALLISFAAFGFAFFETLPELIQEGLDRFYSDAGQTKLHIIFNQPGYAPGDTAFFKAYLFTAAKSNAVKGKKILNIHLTDTTGQSVFYNRVLVNDGSASNQLVLPDTLRGGSYSLIAYTDAMLESQVYFRREFVVSTSKQVVSGNTSVIRAFVEGGNFVAGLPNKLVVTGLAAGDSARVVNSDNATVATVKASESGCGQFHITPERSRSYFINYRGKVVALPPPRTNGVAMTVEGNGDGELVATLQASDSIRALGSVYLILTLNGKLCQAVDVSFDATSRLVIPISATCGSGTAQLTLFTFEGMPLAERLIYIPPRPVTVDLRLSKGEFRTREAIELSVQLRDSAGNTLEGDVAISVYKKELFGNIDHASDLAITASFGGDVNDFGTFSNLSQASYETINTYLITRRWTRFTWDEILRASQKSVSSETPVYFRGQVYTAQKQPVPNGSKITFWLTRHDIRYTLLTKGNVFEFPLFMNLTDEYIMYAVESGGKLIEGATIDINHSPIGKIEAINEKVTREYPYGEFARMRNSVRHSYSHYAGQPGTEQDRLEEERDVTADFTVDIRKYKDFSGVSQILGEVIPMVRNKKINGKEEIRVFLKETAMFASDAPLYLIDGKLTDDTRYFLSLDPQTISTIGVVHSAEELTRYGVLGRNGIVIVETSVPKQDRHVPSGKSTLMIKGLNEEITFNSPKYAEHSRGRIPDLRICLYWNPNVIVDGSNAAKIRFYAGDDTGRYVVKIEGLTSDGLPVHAEKTFIVKF